MTTDAVGSRRGLLIGITKYPFFQAEQQLLGCLNDVDLMQGSLRDHFGFPEANLTVLRNEQATRAGILAALDALVAATNAGDVVVVYYSGHGTRFYDLNYLDPSGKCNAIVPHDSSHDFGRPNRDVTDQEIYLRLRAMGRKTPNITLIFDCCNSGTIARAVLGGASRGVPPDRRPAGEQDRPELTAEQQELVRAAHRGADPNQWFPLSDRYVLLAGCRDEEQSFEYPPEPGANDLVHGTLTHFLHQELIQAAPGTTYRDVFERAARRVTAAYPEQHPQMEGTRDRELFGLRDFAPMRFVPLTGRDGDRVTLAAGAAHGVTVASRWAIYPQGTKAAGPTQAPLARARITAVRGQTSDAEITEASDREAVVADCRAVEVEHDYGDLALRVKLVAAAGQQAKADELGGLLGRSEMLRPSEPGGRVDVAVYLLPKREGGPGDPLPTIESLRRLTEPTWAIVGGGDRLLAPPRPASQEGAAAVVLENLEKIARFRNLLAINNPNPVNPLQGMVQFTLLRRGAGGRWEEARGEGAGPPAYLEGDRIALRIKSTSPQALFIHVLDFGVAFGVGLAYPVEGSNSRHERYETVEYGAQEDREIALELPEGFQGNEGVETLKLIATTREVDFSWMRQGGVREIDLVPPSPLEEMWRRAAFQARGDAPAVPAAEEWITIDRSFVLRRP